MNGAQARLHLRQEALPSCEEKGKNKEIED